jgi:hypothetical protein
MPGLIHTVSSFCTTNYNDRPWMGLILQVLRLSGRSFGGWEPLGVYIRKVSEASTTGARDAVRGVHLTRGKLPMRYQQRIQGKCITYT